jgi:hypothetical protein
MEPMSKCLGRAGVHPRAGDKRRAAAQFLERLQNRPVKPMAWGRNRFHFRGWRANAAHYLPQRYSPYGRQPQVYAAGSVSEESAAHLATATSMPIWFAGQLTEDKMPMTRKEVTSVLGPVDGVTIAEIISTGATVEELREAWAWAFGDEALMSAGRPLPGTRVGELIALLEPEPTEE